MQLNPPPPPQPPPPPPPDSAWWLPPIPTPPPVTDVQPLPSALPAGSAVTNVPWRQVNDGVVSVVPTTDGVELTLLQLGQEEIVPIAVPSPLSALRVDTTVSATNDSNGNEIGLACTTADRAYGARFSIKPAAIDSCGSTGRAGRRSSTTFIRA